MRRRSGFTLVELLVAMALIMFIMAILSEAFSAGLKSFRDLKAIADMAERMRGTSLLLRKELSANHFDGQARMSQPDFWRNGPRPEGFFRVYQGSAPAFASAANPNPQFCIEGDDSTELALGTTFMRSHRATDQMLHFAVKLRGNERGDYFSAGDIPAGSPLTSSPFLLGPFHYQESTNVYNSQWAEVVYFLRQIGDSAQGTPLYALYRRQYLLVPENGVMTATVAGAKSSYPEMSCAQSGGNLYFNCPRDVTMPIRRAGMSTALPNGYAGLLAATDPATGLASYPTMGEDTAPASTYQSADLLLTDVVSFEVRLLLADGDHFESLYEITDVNAKYGKRSKALGTNYPVSNTQFSNADAAGNLTGPLVFDTWASGSNAASALGGAYDYSTWNVAGTASSIPIYQPINGGPPIRVLAVQVVIRLWDVKTQQTRQMTIIQDM